MFLFQALYYALNIEIGEPPDENYHLTLSTIQSESISPIVNNDLENYPHLGAISDQPYLYHYILGILSKINIFDIPDPIFWRLINPLFSIFTLIFVYKIGTQISKKRSIGLLSMLIASQIAMFRYISGSVNYDNLVNLFAVGSIFFLIKFINKFNKKDLLIFLIMAGLGSLTKYTFLPLIIIFGIILIYLFFKNLNKIKKIQFREFSKKTYFLIFGLILVLGLNIQHYGSNWIDYGSPRPSCTQILEYEQCQNNKNFQRDEDFAEDAVSNEINPDPFPKASLRWAQGISIRAWGLSSHTITVYNPLIVVLSLLFVLIGSALSFHPINKNRKTINYILILIATIYVGIIFYVNYRTYIRFERFVAIQGRYLFPVLVPLIPLCVTNFFALKKYMSKKIIISFMIIFALVSFLDFFYINSQIQDEARLDWSTVDEKKYLEKLY